MAIANAEKLIAIQIQNATRGRKRVSGSKQSRNDGVSEA